MRLTVPLSLHLSCQVILCDYLPISATVSVSISVTVSQLSKHFAHCLSGQRVSRCDFVHLLRERACFSIKTRAVRCVFLIRNRCELPSCRQSFRYNDHRGRASSSFVRLPFYAFEKSGSSRRKQSKLLAHPSRDVPRCISVVRPPN